MQYPSDVNYTVYVLVYLCTHHTMYLQWNVSMCTVYVSTYICTYTDNCYLGGCTRHPIVYVPVLCGYV